MSKDRSSFKVKLGRTVQKLTPVLSPLDGLAFPFLKKSAQSGHGGIFILAPPRSGSTLLYQVLRSGLRSVYLSNLQNLLYTTPKLGYAISRRSCQDGSSGFSSRFGFVDGSCGESEGLRFWSYWTGQGLDERDPWKPNKARKLAQKIDRIERDRDGPFIAGFLGHAFCIQELMELFPQALFVHLKRDLLTNARSLMDHSPDSWISTRPKGYEAFLDSPREEQAIEHLLRTHRRILQARGKDEKRFIDISYEDLCYDPRKTVRKVKERKEGLVPHGEQVATEKLPDHFSLRKMDMEDPANRKLQSTLERKMDELPPEERAFFQSIQMPHETLQDRPDRPSER